MNTKIYIDNFEWNYKTGVVKVTSPYKFAIKRFLPTVTRIDLSFIRVFIGNIQIPASIINQQFYATEEIPVKYITRGISLDTLPEELRARINKEEYLLFIKQANEDKTG